MIYDRARISTIFDDLLEIEQKLISIGDISLANTHSSNATKALVISTASYHEYCIISEINFLAQRSNDVRVTEFIKLKALSRQYHSLFDWDTANANKFFSNFGETVLAEYKIRIAADISLKESTKAFLEIGSIRNKIVHNDYITANIQKTLKEIYRIAINCEKFIEYVHEALG